MPSNRSSLVFAVDTIIDGQGGEPIRDQVVVTSDDRISWIGPKSGLPEQYRQSKIIDAPQHTLIPGLIDSHTHVFLLGDRSFLGSHLVFQVAKAIKNLDAMLQMGVTTIRDLGTSTGNPDIYLREAINGGLVMGPRMFTSGDPIRMTAGMPKASTMGIGVDGPYEARKAARNQLGAGADLLKMFATEGVGYSRLARYLAIPVHLREPLPTAPGVGGRVQMNVDEMRSVVEEAHKVEVTVAAHAIETEGIKNALRAGVDTIEHGSGLDEEAVEMMVKQGSALVPTMSILHTIAFRGPEFEYPKEHSESAKRWFDKLLAGIEMARKAGIKIVAGTDTINNDTMAMECSRMVEAGLTPMEAIVAATRAGAEILKQEHEFGTVEVGKKADLVILAENPLDDISSLDKVQYVVKDGFIVREPTSGV